MQKTNCDTEKINQKFTSFLEKAFKESIFEFKIEFYFMQLKYNSLQIF